MRYGFAFATEFMCACITYIQNEDLGKPPVLYIVCIENLANRRIISDLHRSALAGTPKGFEES